MRHAIPIIFVCAAALSAQDDREFADAYQQGRQLTANEASKIEEKLLSHPQDPLDRVRLVAFYTLSPQSPLPQEAIKGRRAHLLWMAEHEPESWLWSRKPYGSAVYVTGERLADPEGFGAIRDHWISHLSRDASNEKIRDNAATFLALGDRETALRLIRAMKNPRYLGSQYALLLLGLTARDYDTGIPLHCDSAVRETPPAQEALAELQNSSDPALIGGAGIALARDGATLWSQGKLDWDYSPLAKSLLARAKALEPNRLDWFIVNPELPQPGESRLRSVKVGGRLMESKNLRTIRPDLPGPLRGARGTVELEIAVGGDGKVIKAIPQSGPRELYGISVNAVEQWLYRPTSVNGTPVIVITRVAIRYE